MPRFLSIPIKYTGTRLTGITAVKLIRFWCARADCTRMGGALPVSAAITGSTSSPLSRKHSNLSTATDESIYAISVPQSLLPCPSLRQTSISTISSPSNMKTRASIPNIKKLTCFLLNAFSTVILAAVPHWRSLHDAPQASCSIFTNTTLLQVRLEHYNTHPLRRLLSRVRIRTR